MTARYGPIIQQTLDLKYPQKQHQEQLTLQNIKFKLFLPKTTLLIAAYQHLKTLSITHCDLRNLQNFPKLSHLQELDLGFNQIQGTFNYLIPLKRLKYLNIEDNIVFESNKFAPLRKIASATRFSQQSSTASLKISICLRNNPFADQESSYINKLRGYGLKVIKEPKEYFDKKKADDEKTKKSAKKSELSSSKKKNNKVKNKKQKKLKNQDHEELDSFYSGQLIISEPSSSSSSSDNDKNNNNPNRSIMNNDQSARGYQRVSQRLGLDNNIRPRMAIRLSQQNNLEFRNAIDNPFLDSDDLNGHDHAFILMEDDSDGSEEINVERFGSNPVQGMEERLRVLQERRARLQQLRGMRRELTIERQRERLQRLREIERREESLRQRHARQTEMERRLEENRQRLLIRPSMLIRDQNPSTSVFGAMRTSSSNSSVLDDEWRVNPFRRRLSGASGSDLAVRVQNANHQINNNHISINNNNSFRIDGSLSRNESNQNLNRYLQQMRSPAYQPLRARESSEFPSIIRLSRIDSYHSQNSNTIVNERQNQINRESQGIRFEMNDSVSNDQDIDNDDENDENQLDDEDEEINHLIEDEIDNDDEEDQMIHVCDDRCEHNVGQDDEDDQDEQDDQENHQDEDEQQDEQQNQDDQEDSLPNNGHNFIFPDLQQNNHEFEDFMMINHQIIDIGGNSWSANLQLHEDRLIRPVQINRDGNPSLSSNPNPDSQSNLQNQGQDEESSQQL